jgi:hypothetical protein
MDRYQVVLHKKPQAPKTEYIRSSRIRTWKNLIVWQEKFIRAAKPHLCEKCRATIKKGQFYKKTTFKKTPNIRAKDFTETEICLSCAASTQAAHQLF